VVTKGLCLCKPPTMGWFFLLALFVQKIRNRADGNGTSVQAKTFRIDDTRSRVVDFELRYFSDRRQLNPSWWWIMFDLHLGDVDYDGRI